MDLVQTPTPRPTDLPTGVDVNRHGSFRYQKNGVARRYSRRLRARQHRFHSAQVVTQVCVEEFQKAQERGQEEEIRKARKNLREAEYALFLLAPPRYRY